jgi:hypothetical protein
MFLSLAFLGLAMTVTPITYSGWPDCLRIANSDVDLVVAPQLGRILRFGRLGGPNLLYESGLDARRQPATVDGWRNYGGDKLWPAPQSLWGWPPEAAYDSTPWTATATSDGAILESARPGEKTGAVFQRQIHLAKHGTTVVIDNMAINKGDVPIRLAVWEVCQVNDPLFCILPSGPQQWLTYDNVDVSALVTQKPSEVFIRRDPSRSLKYGCASPAGYVAAQIGKDRLTLSAQFNPRAEYVDSGKAQQLFTARDPNRYCELEITGPLTLVPQGGSVQFQTRLTISH